MRTPQKGHLYRPAMLAPHGLITDGVETVPTWRVAAFLLRNVFPISDGIEGNFCRAGARATDAASRFPSGFHLIKTWHGTR